MRFSGTLLNSKPENIDPDIVKGSFSGHSRYPSGPSRREEIVAALRSMANAKAMRPEELTVKPLKIGLRHDPDNASGVPPRDQDDVARKENTATVLRCRAEITGYQSLPVRERVLQDDCCETLYLLRD